MCIYWTVIMMDGCVNHCPDLEYVHRAVGAVPHRSVYLPTCLLLELVTLRC